MVNGISVGISDSNPISSAFVVAVIVMAAAGLTNPVIGLMCGAILLITCSTASDMQQDRSTGWRLGHEPPDPVPLPGRGDPHGRDHGRGLREALHGGLSRAQPRPDGDEGGRAAGELERRDDVQVRGDPAQPHGAEGLPDDGDLDRVGLGFAIELARKALKAWDAYQAFAKSGPRGLRDRLRVGRDRAAFALRVFVRRFVNLGTSAWFAAGGVVSSLWNTLVPKGKTDDGLPSDMSSTSLLGGGLIAGDALAALGLGIVGLVGTLASG
jgi:hypothetical protein